jgi:hypothetical protein
MDEAAVDCAGLVKTESELLHDCALLKTESELLLELLQLQSRKRRPPPAPTAEPEPAESELDHDDDEPTPPPEFRKTFEEIVAGAVKERKTVEKTAAEWRESGESWKCLLREPLYELDDTAHRVLRLRSQRVSMQLVQGAKNSLIKARNSLDNIINFINQ